MKKKQKKPIFPPLLNQKSSPLKIYCLASCLSPIIHSLRRKNFTRNILYSAKNSAFVTIFSVFWGVGLFLNYGRWMVQRQFLENTSPRTLRCPERFNSTKRTKYQFSSKFGHIGGHIDFILHIFGEMLFRGIVFQKIVVFGEFRKTMEY